MKKINMIHDFIIKHRVKIITLIVIVTIGIMIVVEQPHKKNIKHATVQELMELNGIGEVTAIQIKEFIDHGMWTGKIEDLKMVKYVWVS